MDIHLPPQNIDAEKGLIASLLLDNTLISQIQLTSDDFYELDHQNIFQAILDLYNLRKPVDVITVSDKLGTGWLEYLALITGSVPTTQNAKHYANIVKGKSIRRQYINKAKQIIDLAYDGEYETVIDFKNDVLQIMDIQIQSSQQDDSKILNVLESTLNNIEGRYKNTNPSKLLYGYSWLDKMTGGARQSELTILAARPSIGKTAFASNIAINIARRGNAVAIFNLEMDKESLMERTLANETNIDSQKIRYSKTLDDTDWALIVNAVSEVSKYKINIFDSVFKIEDIRAECRMLKSKGLLDFIVVDYLQLVDTTKKTSGNTERVSYLSRQFKLLAKEFKTPIWLLSQLNRANEHDDRRPKLIDLRDSGAIEQDADTVIFLHDKNYGKYTEDMDEQVVDIEIIIAKQRNGKRDVFNNIGFKKNTQKFMEVENVQSDNHAINDYKSKPSRKMRTHEDDS